MSFFSSMSQPKNSAYICHVLVSKQRELLFLLLLSCLCFLFVCLFLAFHDLNTVKELQSFGKLFYRKSLVGLCLMFPCDWIRVLGFEEEHHHEAPFSREINNNLMITWSPAAAANCDHLDKVLSAYRGQWVVPLSPDFLIPAAAAAVPAKSVSRVRLCATP